MSDWKFGVEPYGVRFREATFAVILVMAGDGNAKLLGDGPRKQKTAPPGVLDQLGGGPPPESGQLGFPTVFSSQASPTLARLEPRLLTQRLKPRPSKVCE
jgi:hypothetical protein